MTAVAPEVSSVAPVASPRGPKSAAITIQRSHLAEALAAIGSTVSSKPSLPVLSAVRIAVEGSGVRLTVTNLDQFVERQCPADAGGVTGAFLVPCKRLVEIVAALPEGPVRLAPAPSAVKITAGHAHFRLNTVSAIEFPSGPAFEAKASLVVTAGEFTALADRVAFAASTEEARPILNGVLVQMGATALRAVATNGHRLGLSEIRRSGDAQHALADLILPPIVCESVKRLFAAEELVTIEVDHAVTPTSVRISSDRARVSSRLIEGPYPPYQQVIPRDNDRVISVDRHDLLAALKRVLPLAVTVTAKVRIVLAGGRMVLKVDTPDAGSAQDEVPIQHEGETMEIGINGNYLKEILSHLPDGDVQWSFKTPERATLLTTASPPAGATRLDFLLMPVRLVD